MSALTCATAGAAGVPLSLPQAAQDDPDGQIQRKHMPAVERHVQRGQADRPNRHSGGVPAKSLTASYNAPRKNSSSAVATTTTMTQTASAAQGFVFLRAVKVSDPPPQILPRTSLGAPWTGLPSSRTGQDIVSASYAGTGDYLLLRPLGAKDARQGSGLITRLFEIAFGLLLLALLVLLSRRAGNNDKTGASSQDTPNGS